MRISGRTHTHTCIYIQVFRSRAPSHWLWPTAPLCCEQPPHRKIHSASVFAAEICKTANIHALTHVTSNGTTASGDTALCFQWLDSLHTWRCLPDVAPLPVRSCPDFAPLRRTDPCSCNHFVCFKIARAGLILLEKSDLACFWGLVAQWWIIRSRMQRSAVQYFSLPNKGVRYMNWAFSSSLSSIVNQWD